MTENRIRNGSEPARITLVDVVVAVASFAGIIGAVFIYSRIVAGVNLDEETDSILWAAVSFFAHLIAVVFLIWYLKKRGVGAGLNPLRKDAWHLLWEAPLIVLGSLFAGILVSDLIVGAPESDQTSQDAQELSVLLLIIQFVTLAVVPLFEELLMRRVVMGYLNRFMPAFASILLSSAAFALLHFNPSVQAMTAFFVAGIGLALVARRHQSLWASVIVHTCNNLLGLVASALVVLA